MWDIAATEKAQAQQDVEMHMLLALLTASAERGEVSVETATTSCLRPMLWSQLHTGSLLEVSSRPERMSMYLSMLSLVKALAAQPELKAVLAQQVHCGRSDSSSVVQAVTAVQRQVSHQSGSDLPDGRASFACACCGGGSAYAQGPADTCA